MVAWQTSGVLDGEDRLAAGTSALPLTRRALLRGGAGALFVSGSPAWARRDPLRVGHAEGSGYAPAQVQAFCATTLGRPIVLTFFPSLGSLRDHLEAGALDAALLVQDTPGLSFVSQVLPHGPNRATLVVRAGPPTGATPVIGRGAADPAADAALARLWASLARSEGAPRWLTLSPAQLMPNVAAGRIDAALVFGVVAPAPGLVRIAIDAAGAARVAPRLALARRPVFADG